MQPIRPVLVACCGNTTACDDGVGPMVAHQLMGQTPGGVEVIDLDARGGAILSLLGGRSALLVVDAVVMSGRLPGEIVDVDYLHEHGPMLAVEVALSTHGWSVASELQLGQRLGILPPVVRLMGIVIDRTDIGGAPDPCVAQGVPGLAARVLARARQAVEQGLSQQPCGA